MNLRTQLIETALTWERRFGVAPQVTNAVAEYDAARLLGGSEEDYARAMAGRTAVSKGYDFVLGGLRYQVKANRPSGKPGSPVTKVAQARNYDWDRLIWILYDSSYTVQEAWLWKVEAYRARFAEVSRVSPNDMREGTPIHTKGGPAAIPVSSMGVAVETNRLVLRPLVPTDALDVARLAGRREIADTTISIPHPYSEDQARTWIKTHTTEAKGKEVVFAITLKETGNLAGTMGLREIDTEHSQAEMGFWIGVEWWGQGYATEAARAVVRFAFEQLKLNRVYAHHMVRNPASGRVLEKVGMRREGLLRQRVRKWGVFEDVVILSTLRSDSSG